MAIRLILLDMDGTLLGRSQVAVTRRNMEALQRVIREGVMVVPCTGRVFDMLPPQIQTQEGIRYFVTCHGARVYDKGENAELYLDLIPPGESAALLQMLEGRNLYNEIAARGTIFLESAIEASMERQPVPSHHKWYIKDKWYTAVEKPSEFFRAHGIGVEKMNLYGIPEPLRQTVYDEVTRTGSVRHTRPGAGENLEFSHATLDKLAATSALLSHIGVGFDEVMALGDSSSDVDILKASAIGVVMGNAPENIRAAANYVTATNVQDGVAYAIEKYLA